jgi:hypothetical protein
MYNIKNSFSVSTRFSCIMFYSDLAMLNFLPGSVAYFHKIAHTTRTSTGSVQVKINPCIERLV